MEGEVLESLASGKAELDVRGTLFLFLELHERAVRSALLQEVDLQTEKCLSIVGMICVVSAH